MKTTTETKSEKRTIVYEYKVCGKWYNIKDLMYKEREAMRGTGTFNLDPKNPEHVAFYAQVLKEQKFVIRKRLLFKITIEQETIIDL